MNKPNQPTIKRVKPKQCTFCSVCQQRFGQMKLFARCTNSKVVHIGLQRPSYRRRRSQSCNVARAAAMGRKPFQNQCKHYSRGPQIPQEAISIHAVARTQW